MDRDREEQLRDNDEVTNIREAVDCYDQNVEGARQTALSVFRTAEVSAMKKYGRDTQMSPVQNGSTHTKQGEVRFGLVDVFIWKNR